MLHIFHHNDADGYAAGYLVYKHYKNLGIKDNQYKYHEMNYNKDFPLQQIQPEDIVYIVDFSIDPNIMIELLKITKNVIWIDHHISAIDKYKDWWNLIEIATGEDYIEGLRLNGISGCALTWLFLNQNWTQLHKDSRNNEKDFYNELMYDLDLAPIWIQLVNDWDVWNHYIPETKPFMIALSNKLSMEEMSKLDQDSYEDTPIGKCQIGDLERCKYIQELINIGFHYIEYRDNWTERLRENYGFVTDITDLQNNHRTMYVLNVGNANSEFFGNLIDKYDIITSFCFNGNKFVYSMYSNKDYINCAELCKYYGVDNGGGHKGAAGFTHKDLLWTK